MKSPGIFEMEYYGVYYYADVIKNVLDNPLNFFSNLEIFLDIEEPGLRFISPFPKNTYFHQFIKYVLETLFYEEACQIDIERLKIAYGSEYAVDLDKLPIEKAFLLYSLPFKKFSSWLHENYIDIKEVSIDECVNYYTELMETLEWETFLEKTSEAVFYILFLNRDLLKKFNEMIADSIESIGDIENIDKIYINRNLNTVLKKNYKVKRKNMPTWVKRAVFFRDRGHCVFCGDNLTGLLSLLPKENFDHIVPLNQYGINDISNIQLLCTKCNGEKSGNSSKVSKRYEKWF